MTAIPEHCVRANDAFPDTESLTVLLVAASSRDLVAAALDVDLTEPVENGWSGDVETRTAWAILQIPGGVVAVESTGYGDPTLAALRALSQNGGACAVVRSNIQAHWRFGCARDGELVFDDDEYTFIEDPDVVPAEVRPLFDLVWDDLEGDDIEDDDGPDPFLVGLAMAELIAGVEVTPDQVAMVYRSGFFAAPNLVYAGSLDE